MGELDARLPLEVPVLVGGDPGATSGVDSTDPGAPDRLVARAGRAGAGEADAAVAAAGDGAREWGARGAAERAQALVGAAAALRERRLELAALAVRECAKPWAEADADVCEAIDFLEYYARAAHRAGPWARAAPGARRAQLHALRATWGGGGGRTVELPAGHPHRHGGRRPGGRQRGGAQARRAVTRLLAGAGSGAPRRGSAAVDAFALLPGFGDAGAALVRHPGVHVIAFTGSGAVGLEIVRAAAETPDGQAHVKRVVAEMGGKNCVIVDSDADLDEAVPAIVDSAFGYAGQKCSAAARVLAHEAVHDALVERIAGAVEVLSVGQAERFGTDVPPVIDEEARDRVRGYADEAERLGRIAARAEAGAAEGWFCSPTVAADLDPEAQVLREEVFGPLLTVEPVGSVEEACEVVDALPFALTGGLFSRSPATVMEVSRRSPVGNLYVNRGITGAMVGRQPFGGNRRSGVGVEGGRARTTCCSSPSRAWSPRTRCATGWWSSEGRPAVR